MLEDKSHVSTVITAEHDDIKDWAEVRKARPVRQLRFEDETVSETVRFRFPEDKFPNEEDLTWEEFFEIFDRNRMEFVFEDIADEASENKNVYQFRPRKMK